MVRFEVAEKELPEGETREFYHFLVSRNELLQVVEIQFCMVFSGLVFYGIKLSESKNEANIQNISRTEHGKINFYRLRELVSGNEEVRKILVLPFSKLLRLPKRPACQLRDRACMKPYSVSFEPICIQSKDLTRYGRLLSQLSGTDMSDGYIDDIIEIQNGD